MKMKNLHGFKGKLDKFTDEKLFKSLFINRNNLWLRGSVSWK